MTRIAYQVLLTTKDHKHLAEKIQAFCDLRCLIFMTVKTDDVTEHFKQYNLGKSLVTMAWHVPRLQMKETASRYGG
jgi:hypothetical protein